MTVHKASVIAAALAVWVSGAQAQQTQKPTPAGQGTTAKPSPAPSAAQSKSTLAGADKNFFTKAAEAGHKEIALAQVAQSKATSPNVKSLAERLLKDHQQSDQELQSLAQSKGVTLPAHADDKATTARFEKLEGPAFDRSYSQMMVQDHNTAIKLFQQASASKDSEVKAFADKTLPTLREHLKMAQDALGSLKTSTSGAGTQKPMGGQPPAQGDRPAGQKPTPKD